jgi:hypothetical protein
MMIATKVGNDEETASEKLAPLLDAGAHAEESSQAGDDQQEMAGGANHNNDVSRPLQLTGSNKQEQLLQPLPDKALNNDRETIPKGGDEARQ